jgi:ABC-2 type transport system permease protein
MSQDWLPAIGYQPTRELLKPAERRAQGLAPRPLFPLLADAQGSQDITSEGRYDFNSERLAVEAVVGTDADQIAVAPGSLRRTWTEGGRRYFHYATDAPIGNEYAFFSADYAVHEERRNDVEIQLY